MINDDILIKYVRQADYVLDWPEQVRIIKERLEELKEGFPGLGNDCLSLIQYKDLRTGDIFIIDPFIDSEIRRDTAAPTMFYWLTPEVFRVEGIGRGLDLERDPDRLRYRWKDCVGLKMVEECFGYAPFYKFVLNFPILKVDVRPTPNGGPGYYYFYRSPRDLRY